MNYLNVQQTLELLNKDLPQSLIPFDLPQIADLCSQGILTPVFLYHFYISKPYHYEDSGKPRYATNGTDKFNGYLTHDHLISLIDGYTDSLSLTNAATNADDEMELLLFKCYESYPEDAECDPFTVTLKSIRLSASEIQSYIDLQFFEDAPTPEQQLIAELESEVEVLRKQLKRQNDKPANDDTPASEIDWHSLPPEKYPPELHLALIIWQRIYQDNELKDSHITSHNGKFEVIAKRMGLDPSKELGKRISMVINNAHKKNDQSMLADPLRAIESLNMPAKKVKATP